MVSDTGAVTKIKEEEEPEVDRAAEAEELKQKREEEINALQAQLQKLKKIRQRMEEVMEQNQNTTRQVEESLHETKDETKKLEDAYKVKKRVLDLLPNAEENLKKLQEISEASAKRLLMLATEWEKHRAPLVAKSRRRKQGIEDRKSEVVIKVDQIKRMRAEMKRKAMELRQKDEIYKQVLSELKKMPKSINRQVYIRRIMDIMKNLERQKIDIKKVLEDIRQIQKDINSVSESSKRSFDMADEIIFQAAKGKKEEVTKQSYKNVVELRDGFLALVKFVEETGRTKNEIRDIESQIAALEGRNTNLNKGRVESDLAQVKKENKGLSSKIKKIKK